MIVYHGTNNAKKFDISQQYIAPKKKGQVEYGAGLYTTASHDIASGFGKVIALDIELNEKEHSKNVIIKMEEINHFLYCLSKAHLKRFSNFIENKEYRFNQQIDELNAEDFQNYMVILNPNKYHLISQDINDFLVSKGAKYTSDHYKGRDMIIIHDFSIIKQKLEPQLIDYREEEFSYNQTKNEKSKSLKP